MTEPEETNGYDFETDVGLKEINNLLGQCATTGME